MGKGKKSAYIKFKYDKSKHCQCGTGKKEQIFNRGEHAALISALKYLSKSKIQRRL
jgi:hypothetical protein